MQLAIVAFIAFVIYLIALGGGGGGGLPAEVSVDQAYQMVQEGTFLLWALITASFGLATYPDDANSVKNLLLRADAAMYYIKRSTKNAVGGADE